MCAGRRIRKGCRGIGEEEEIRRPKRTMLVHCTGPQRIENNECLHTQFAVRLCEHFEKDDRKGNVHHEHDENELLTRKPVLFGMREMKRRLDTHRVDIPNQHIS